MPGSLPTGLKSRGAFSLLAFAAGVRAQCDGVNPNCHSALFPCGNSTALQEGIDYCSTAGAYRATNYPAQATAACGNASNWPYIAACRCPVGCPSLTVTSASDCSSSTTIPGGTMVPVSETTSTILLTTVSSSGSSQTNSMAMTSTISDTYPVSSMSATSSAPSMSTGTSSTAGGGSSNSTTTMMNSGSTTSSNSATTIATSSLTSGAPGNTYPTSTVSSIAGSSSTDISAPGSGAGSATSSLTSSGLSGSETSTLSGSGSTSASSVSSASMAWQSSSGRETSPTTSPSSMSGLNPTSTAISDSTSAGTSPSPTSGASGTETQTSPSSPQTSQSSTSPPSTPTPGISSTFSDATTSPPVGATCTSTAIDTGILDNGDFETGLSPWSLDLVDLFSTSYALASPGANGSCTSFEAVMAANPQTQNLRENLRLRSDLVFSRPGELLRIAFSVRFAARNAARVVVSTNDQQLLVVSALNYGPGGNATNATTSASAGPQIVGGGEGEGEGEMVMVMIEREGEEGQWMRIVIDYTTRDRLLQLSFSFELDAAPANTIWLDQITIFPSAAANPPVSPHLPLPLPPATTFATAIQPAWTGR